MLHNAKVNKASNLWFYLLALPLIAILLVPSYNSIEPKWIGFPFFYWYQLLWVLISAIITWIVYLKTKNCCSDSDLS